MSKLVKLAIQMQWRPRKKDLQVIKILIFVFINEYFERFSFIYDINYLKSMPKEDFLRHCNDLGAILQEGENCLLTYQ